MRQNLDYRQRGGSRLFCADILGKKIVVPSATPSSRQVKQIIFREKFSPRSEIAGFFVTMTNAINFAIIKSYLQC